MESEKYPRLSRDLDFLDACTADADQEFKALPRHISLPANVLRLAQSRYWNETQSIGQQQLFPA